jgi:multidrug efflux pump subunit AcrA (membrane-fusion protein)
LPLPRRPLEWGLAILATVLIAIGVTSLGSGSSTSAAATKRTATVGKGVVQSTVSGNGTLEPAQKLELSFGASGEVTAIDVKAGETVTKGEVLAEVDSSSARASLASAEAKLLEAEEAVETAAEAEEEESEEVAYEGDATTEFVGLISEGGTAAAPKEETEEQKVEEPTKEEPAASKKEKEKPTASTKAKEEPTGSTKAKEEPTGSTSAKEEPTGSTTAKEGTERPEASKEEAAAPQFEAAAPQAQAAAPSEGTQSSAAPAVSLPTAEANLREAQLSVKSGRQEVRETTLRAPISGTIASVAGSVGETVNGGPSGGSGTSEASSPEAIGGESTSSGSASAFMVLAQLQRLKLEVSFSESDIGKVSKGQTATVSIDSMEGTELAGRVTAVSLLPSEGSTGVVEYPATILLTQSAKGLRAGMSASAEVVVEQVKNAITVTGEALTGKTVTVEEEGKEVTKTVTTGLEGDETTQIVSGLKVGQTVVLPDVTVASGVTGAAEGREAAGGAFPGGGFPGGGFPGGGGGFSGGPPSGAFPGRVP